MAKGGSSARWKQRQARDPYVRRAQAEGFRSRAAYKLQELNSKDRLLGRGQVVVDLGAAPGAWCQLAVPAVGPAGRVLAVDLLPMEPLDGVDFIQGDFLSESIVESLTERIGPAGCHLVMSDMAPNMTGMRDVDQARAMELAELASDFAARVLRPGGAFLVKLFQGAGFAEFVAASRQRFKTVKLRKPAASRPENREIYLVARDVRL